VAGSVSLLPARARALYGVRRLEHAAATGRDRVASRAAQVARLGCAARVLLDMHDWEMAVQNLYTFGLVTIWIGRSGIYLINYYAV
jgi:hypothetical protein